MNNTNGGSRAGCPDLKVRQPTEELWVTASPPDPTVYLQCPIVHIKYYSLFCSCTKGVTYLLPTDVHGGSQPLALGGS